MTQEIFPNSYPPNVQRLSPIAKQVLFESPYNAAQELVNFAGGEGWQLELTYVNLREEARGELLAFFTKLRISRNTFLVTNHTAPQLGAYGGTPVVSVSSQAGTYLVISSAGGDVQNWARVGDFVSINNELKMVLDDVTTDSLHVASLSIWPPLRTVPDSGDTLVVTSPMGEFRLLDGTEFNVSPPAYKTDISILAVEAVTSERVHNL